MARRAESKTKTHRPPDRPVAKTAQPGKPPGNPWPSKGTASKATSQSANARAQHRPTGDHADQGRKPRWQNEGADPRRNNPVANGPKGSNSSRHVPGGNTPLPGWSGS